MAERTDFRTTVNFSQTVAEWANELMVAKGFNGNLSQFLAALVREEKDREEKKVISLHEAAKAGVPMPEIVSRSVSYSQSVARVNQEFQKGKKQTKAQNG